MNSLNGEKVEERGGKKAVKSVAHSCCLKYKKEKCPISSGRQCVVFTDVYTVFHRLPLSCDHQMPLCYGTKAANGISLNFVL